MGRGKEAGHHSDGSAFSISSYHADQLQMQIVSLPELDVVRSQSLDSLDSELFDGNGTAEQDSGQQCQFVC